MRLCLLLENGYWVASALLWPDQAKSRKGSRSLPWSTSQVVTHSLLLDTDYYLALNLSLRMEEGKVCRILPMLRPGTSPGSEAVEGMTYHSYLGGLRPSTPQDNDSPNLLIVTLYSKIAGDQCYSTELDLEYPTSQPPFGSSIDPPTPQTRPESSPEKPPAPTPDQANPPLKSGPLSPSPSSARSPTP